MHWRRALLAVVLALAGAPATRADPAVARPTYEVAGEERSHSTVFFLPAPDEVGVAAVGAAHSFDLAELAQAGEIRFVRPASDVSVSVASRYLTAPGRPFRLPGASLRDDYLVFALDVAPTGVRVLEPERGVIDRPGSRVRILGIPNAIAQDEDDVFGTLIEVADERMEVELDVAADLRGWGGAPVLSATSGRVLGILEGAWPVGGTYRLGVAPIEGVLAALATPLADGLGQPFAHYAAYAWNLPAVKANPFASPEKEPDAMPAPRVVPREPPPLPDTGVAREEAGPVPAGGPDATEPAGGAARTARASAPPRRYLDQPEGPVELRLDVEYPVDGAVVGNRSGAFLAGQAMAVPGDFKRFDVVFVIDTSDSTSEPTGQDINGNGVVGRAPLGSVGAIFSIGSTDPGDSILAAEILAVRTLLEGLDPRTTRVGLVSFAGEPPPDSRGIRLGRLPPAAVTEEPLTSEYGRIEDALERIFRRGPSGATHMAAGVDQATVELLGLRGSLSQRSDADKLVLFFTDGRPTLPYPNSERFNVQAVMRAAERARRGGITIHSFALGPDALEGPIAVVEMAERTEGFFTPVRNPGDLMQVVEGVRFTDIARIHVRNLTTGTDADQVRLNADGSWTALVPLEVGRNEIEILALADDGRTTSQRISLQHAPGEADPVVPRELVAQRNRLLERKLLEIRRGRIEAERAAAEETRKELQIEIERERAAAAARAERQRKELELEVESAGGADEGDGGDS